jgi:hypothetical protein
MGKVKQWSVEKKDQIEKMLISMWASLGMDIPSNFEDIVQYCYEDVCETADPVKWHSGDIAIAFRRWIEDQHKVIRDITPSDDSKDYFKIVHKGYQKDLEREEIQVHCGENGNLFLIKTEQGFIVDVYNQDDNIFTNTIWEDDLLSDEEELGTTDGHIPPEQR